MAAADSDSHPFAGCSIVDSTDQNTYRNHPENTLAWLENSISYSGRSVAHIFYIAILFTLASLSRAIFKRTSMLHGGKLTATSHVLILITVGGLLAVIVAVVRAKTTQECLRGAWMLTENSGGSDISVMYFAILPILIFKPSFDLDYNFILRNIDTIVILGGGSFVIVVCVMTVFIVTSIEPFREIALDSTDFPDYGEFRSFAMGGMLAVIISIADSSLILRLLKEIGGKNNRLSAIIENGGWVATCLGTTLFEIFRISVQATQTWGHGTWISAVSWKLIISPLFGFVVCKCNGKVLSWIINDPLAEALLIYATLFSTFSFGNLIGLSGPIAIMAYNIFFDHSQISRDAEQTVKRFNETMQFFATIYLSGTVGFVFVEEIFDHVNETTNLISVYNDIYWVFVIYAMMTSIRLIIVQATSYLVGNATIKWKESFLMSWGEVRGPVNMILAFIVLLDPGLSWVQDCEEGRFNAANAFSNFDRTIGSCEYDLLNLTVTLNRPLSKEGVNYTLSHLYSISQQKIFFYGVGVLILTQIINALSLDKITEKLGIYQISTGQKNTMSTAVSKIRNDVSKSCLTMRYDGFLTDADWDVVNAKSLISYPYKIDQTEKRSSESMNRKTLAGLIAKNNENVETTATDLEEARQRVLNALKTSFAKQRNDGLITDDAVTVLNQAVNSVQNEQQGSNQFVSINQLKRNWKLFGFFPKIASLIDRYLYDRSERVTRIIWRKPWLRKAHKFAGSDRYEVFMQSVIFGNMVMMIIEYMVGERAIESALAGDVVNHDGMLDESLLDGLTTDEMKDQIEILNDQDAHCGSLTSGALCTSDKFYAMNLVFLFVYIVDVIFKAGILTVKEYWSQGWNRFDFVIVVVSVVETIVSLLIKQYVKDEVSSMNTSDTSSLQVFKLFKVLKMVKVLRAVRTMRMARLLRFSRTIVPFVIKWIQSKIDARMSFGYDVGRGFIKSIDELESAFDMIAGDNKTIKRKLRRISEKSRTIVIRDLGLLQKNYPGIATSVKTRTAIRTLINVMFDSVKRLQSGGVLDDFEVRVLHDQINILIKDMATLPIVMETIPDTKLFLNITWVNGNNDLGEFLKEQSELVDFDLGDIIVQDDEEPDAIFLIVTGLVKIIHGEYRGDDYESCLSLTQLEEEIEDAEDEDRNLVCDYASTGAVVGELGCLIGESAGVSVLCETSVLAYQIPVETIRAAFDKFPKLKDSLWKVVGLKLAVPLLQKDFKWGGFTADEIRIHLQGAQVMTFDEGDEFKLDSDVADCILIDGTVIHQDEMIDAPAIIHHIEIDKLGQGTEVQDSILSIPCRAVILVVKKKRQLAKKNDNDESNDRTSLSRNSYRTSNSRTSFNAVKIDHARRRYLAGQNGLDELPEYSEDMS